MYGLVEGGSGQPPPEGDDEGLLIMVIIMMIVMMMMISTLMMGASSSQESATRVKGRMQRVVQSSSVNREQNTRLTWDRETELTAYSLKIYNSRQLVLQSVSKNIGNQIISKSNERITIKICFV